MFKVGWSVAADRRLDKINEIWGNQLNIYGAVVIATSREAATLAERMMKLLLGRHGWKIDGLPPLEGHSEFFSTRGLIYAYDKCMTQVLATMHSLEERTHVITARDADQTAQEMFTDIVAEQAEKSVSADNLLTRMIESKRHLADIPKIIDAMTWDCFPNSVIAALSDALSSKHSAFATYASGLWEKFGSKLLDEPKQFIKIASSYGTSNEKDLLALLAFISSHNVVIKAQSSEWVTEVLSTLRPKAMVELIESTDIDLRMLNFSQRTKVFGQLLWDEGHAELLKAIADRVDDLHQLKAEAADRRALERHCGDVNFILNNLRHIDQGRTPKNFPGVLASLYFDHFDGLVEKTIIRPSHWPGHEQIHLETFKRALTGLIENTANKSLNHLFTTGPVFQKAVLAAMLNLYASCFKKDEANNHLLMEELAGIKHTYLAEYFDQDRSTNFALVRDQLRRSHQRLLATKNGGSFLQEDLSAQTCNEKLNAILCLTEEGRYYAMYAFQAMVFEFGDLVTAPFDQTGEQRRSIVLQYIRGLWSLVRKDIIHHHYIFNSLFLYLHAWSSQFELENVPAAHPQAVL